MRLFSTEQVSKYHPDKYADQISDAVLDECLRQDQDSRVACETMVKGNVVVLAGEITSTATLDYADIVSRVGKKLGYKVDRVLTYIEKQSPEIESGLRIGTQNQGAGDQGMMYGYACRETESLLPFGFDLANRIIKAIEEDVERNNRQGFTGDAKCQVTVDLDAPPDASSVKKILVSACSTNGMTIYGVKERIQQLIRTVNPLLIPTTCEIVANPAGLWTQGGPAADAGLTGRKIVCDQYGGYCPVGGGAFSGKDPSKVDRSGAYMARRIACDIVKNFDSVQTAEIQIAYAIGRAEPMSVSVKTTGQTPPAFDDLLVAWIEKSYDLTPAGIISALEMKSQSYERLAEGCHYRQGSWV